LRRRSLHAVLATTMVWLLVVPPAAAGDEPPPDQVDEPAPGEGEPLEDPSDPPPPAYSAAYYPSATVSLSGQSWRRPAVKRVHTRNQYMGAVRASRLGWSHGARRVVLVGGQKFAGPLMASTLAGAANAPVLMTGRKFLYGRVAHEIRRLRPQKVFLIGSLSRAVSRRVHRIGADVERLRADSVPKLAMRVARRAVQLGASRRTAFVVNPKRWRSSLGVPALAANSRHPIVFSRRSGGREKLTDRVKRLGARRVVVFGGRDVITRKVVAKLPHVTRVRGSGAMATVAKTGRRGRTSGMNGRPLIVSGRHWGDAAAWGAFAGDRRDAVVLASEGRGLSEPVQNWLSDIGPGRVMLVRGARDLPDVAKCQIAQGQERNWFCAERTLRQQGYAIPRGAVDGYRDRFSVWAIYAFEKVAPGLTANGYFGNDEWQVMLRNPRMRVRRPDLPAHHVEINLERQLILIVQKGKVRNAIHTSTGKASTPTVRGTFTVYEKRPYRQTNHMYYSIFFYGGYAMHGYPEIPLYPASHGCARTYDGNQNFIYNRVFLGDRVATY
jgi:hypothetical protein